MPILRAEPNLFPEDLLTALADEPDDRQWWAVYTKARQEKALARQLLSYQVPFYLPLVPKENLIRSRKVRSYVPLFTGYLFLLGNEAERVRCLTTNRVSQILTVEDQEQLTHDLRQVQQLIELGAPLTIERRLAPGQAVRIKSGPMEGFEGTVISRRARTRLLVAVHMLQQGVSVEIDDFLIEPVG